MHLSLITLVPAQGDDCSTMLAVATSYRLSFAVVQLIAV